LPAILAAISAALGAGTMVGGVVVAGRFAHLGVRLSLIAGSFLLALPALLTMVALGRTPLRETLRLRGGGQRTLLLAAALGLSLWVLSLGLLELQTVVWPPPEGYIEQFRALHEQLRAKNALDWLFSLLAIAVMPALCEELLVRGVVLPSFRPLGEDIAGLTHKLLVRRIAPPTFRGIVGTALALVASALVFAAIHFDLYRFPFTFAAGLVLGAIRLRSGLLGPSMLSHATLNALTFTAAPFLDDPTQPLPDPRPGLGWALFLGGLAVTLLLLRRLRSVDGQRAGQ
jgi:membrane protease YdiL (CAAX protease family)